MKFLLEYKMHKNKVFWKDADELVNILIENSNFGPFWNFKDKYPTVIKDSDEPHDKILVPLHNTNTIRKRISFGQWFWMWMLFIRDIKKYYDNSKGFDYWVNNVPVKLYRGVYSYDDVVKDLELNIEANIYRSFTFDKETAIKFTQSDWAGHGWVDKKHRNGIIYEIDILPKDIQIVSNEQHEFEGIVKGPLKYSKYFIVKEGEIQSESRIGVL